MTSLTSAVNPLASDVHGLAPDSTLSQGRRPNETMAAEGRSEEPRAEGRDV